MPQQCRLPQGLSECHSCITSSAEELIGTASLREAGASSAEPNRGVLGLEQARIREVDPQDPDIYVDALFAPLYYRGERIIHQRDHTGPLLQDYILVGIFLVVNAALQLLISVQIHVTGYQTYGEIGDDLMDGTCWRVSQHQEYVGLLYPPHLVSNHSNAFDFDCLQQRITLSLFPEKLDLNKDGFWSTHECAETETQLALLGSKAATNMTQGLREMVKYDKKHRPGSRSFIAGASAHVDMDFFEHYRNEIRTCVITDKNLCGNMEAEGKLSTMLPGYNNEEERVLACQETYDSFCLKVFGTDYKLANDQRAGLCGKPSFTRVRFGVIQVEYSAVATYMGDDESILSIAFESLLVLLLSIWVMIMIKEARSICNLALVIWFMPFTDDQDPTFTSYDAEAHRFKIKKLPIGHKYFALLVICLPRSLIAVVVLYVGLVFLTITSNLQDLILNSTALGFLIEVDNMIHFAMLGHSFQRHVMDRCDVLTADVGSDMCTRRGPYVFLFLTILFAFVYAMYAYRNSRGLLSIGEGMQCLCHLDGNCYAKLLLPGTNVSW